MQGKVSLNAFENWLDPYIWDLEHSSSGNAVDLVYAIQLLFAERDHRRLDASALREELRRFVNDIHESVQEPAAGIVSPRRDRKFSVSRSVWVNPPRLALLPV